MKTTDWAATIEVAAPSSDEVLADEHLETATDRLHTAGGAVSAGPGRVGGTFTVAATIRDDAARAVAFAAITFRDALRGSPAEHWPIVAAEVLTPDEQDRRLAEPLLPDLVGLAEAAELLGVSKQRVGQLDRERDDFPAPVQRLASGPVWARTAVEAFDRRWERRSGRPPSASAAAAHRGASAPR